MNNTNFDQAAWEAFQEAAAERYDFSTCMRTDGSKYGSPGRCIKGSETSPASKDDKKSGSKSSSGGGSSSGEYRTRPKGAIESDMKKLTSSGAMNQKGTAGVKAREEHAKLKAELKKPLEGANSKSGTSTKQQPKTEKKSGGGSTMDKASRSEYGKQSKKEQQAAKDIKREISRNGKTPELEKKLKQTEARADKFERMAKTGVFEK